MKEKITAPKKIWPATHVLLLIWLAWIGAGLMAKYAEGRLVGNEPLVLIERGNVKDKTLKSSSSNNRPPDYSAILNRNIFNADQVAAEALSDVGRKNIESAPPTTLPLSLMGTFVDANNVHSYAIIQNNSSKLEDLYAVNDEILQAKIVKIDRLRVFIERSNKLESINLDQDLIEKLRQSSDESSADTKSSLSTVSKTGSSEYDISTQYLSDQLNNMSRLMTQIRAVPNLGKDGKAEGFKVSGIRPGSVFSKIGLKNNDIVKQVNGSQLNSTEKGLELFQALRHEKSFAVDVERGGTNMTLTLNVQ
ncbi:MAG: type II secretion system protein GspC [Nitrospinota bacterium]